MPKPRTGQAPPMLDREAFGKRFRIAFYDPAFQPEEAAIARLEQIAWKNYQDDHKAPRTVKAGPGFADPDYDLSIEWLETHERLKAAEARQKDPKTKSRVLVVCGSARNDGTCPGEMSKTYRLAKIVEETLEGESIETEFLDLSTLQSGYAIRIYPCKACVSTAQPLCHWPCSCYPNHAFQQVGDWMASTRNGSRRMR